MKHWTISIISCVLWGILTPHTFAHKPSDSYVRLNVTDKTIQGQWDIALRDVDYAIGIDANLDHQITWGELRTAQDAIAAYAMARIEITNNGSVCFNRVTEHLVDHHSDGAYAVLRFSAACSTVPQELHVQYQLLFDLDPSHRGLLSVEHDGSVQTAVFSPERQRLAFTLTRPSPWRTFAQFGVEGVWHIWIGYDHILFLLSLLLPAVLRWTAGQWQGRDSFQSAFVEVLKVVTAFTVAHSITLSLAVIGIVTLPSRWVESIIAASVLLVALYNLYPIVRTRLWVMAFGFGLVHGLGFASVLLDLGLPGSSMFLALAGFNLGVEAGQVAIVMVFFPLAFLVRHTWCYQQLAFRYGSVMIAMVAALWLLERSLDLNMWPGDW